MRSTSTSHVRLRALCPARTPLDLTGACAAKCCAGSREHALAARKAGSRQRELRLPAWLAQDTSRTHCCRVAAGSLEVRASNQKPHKEACSGIPGRRGLKVQAASMRRTSPVPVWTCASAAVRLRSCKTAAQHRSTQRCWDQCAARVAKEPSLVEPRAKCSQNPAVQQAFAAGRSRFRPACCML